MYTNISFCQKSDIFKCQVVDKSSNIASVRVDILNKETTPYCSKDEFWPLTGAGIIALLQCPKMFVNNVVSRLCMTIDVKTAKWQVPDFSNCITEELNNIMEKVSSSCAIKVLN